MNKSRLVPLVFIFSFTLIAFQNCTKVENVSFSSGAPAKPTLASDNGHPYDGKMYFLKGSLCPDGTDVQARIELSSPTTAELVRKDCAEITPVLLTQNDFQMSPSNNDELIYLNQVYIAGSTYFVSQTGSDSGTGSLSSPWRTIQKAADSVAAGDLVILQDGIFEEPQIRFTRSGTAAAPIKVRAQNKWLAVVSSISGCSPGVGLYASYIHLQDLRFQVSPRSVSCTSSLASNVHIRAVNLQLPSQANPSSGYVGFRASGLKLDGDGRFQDIRSDQDFTVIENSEIYHSIEIFASLNSIVRNNLVFGQSSHGNSIFADGGVRNAQIYNNIIHQKVVGGRGILLGGAGCDTCHFDNSTNIETYNSVAYNNVVLNDSGGAIAALVFMGAKDSAFVNNVVINGNLAMLVGGPASGVRSPVSNPTFKNNIVMCNGGPLTTLAFGWNYTGTLALDFNNLFTCSGAPAQANAINGDPMFVNATSDWHLQAGSPAIGSGTAFSMSAYGGETIDVSQDFNGVQRISPWNLGVYQ